MITVACSGCGTTFHARDEHAGKRGKCPKCGAPVLVPAVADAPSSAPPPATRPPVPTPRAPVAAARGSRGARGAREGVASHAGAGRRGAHAAERPAGGPPKWLVPAIAGVVVLGVVAFFTMGSGGPDPVKTMQDGIDAFARGDHAAAIAAFSSVPRDSALYGKAQERLQEAKDQQAALSSTQATQDSLELATKIDALRRDWVEKPGSAAPRYPAHTRYLLKLARDFTERFPTHPRTPDMRGLATYYRNVASLDKPPTELDVRVECEWRADSRQYVQAMAAIDEYAATPDADPVQVIKLRDDLREMADKDWKNIKALLERTLAFEAGNENWKQILSRTTSYLAAIGTLDGVGDEARELNARARAALEKPGG